MLSPTRIVPIALLPLALFSPFTFAQGTTGGSQASCPSSEAFRYQGCFSDTANGPHAGFTWELSSDSNSAHYYPSYTGGITVDICLQGCRGHGFRYAALYNSVSCYCSYDLPNPSASESASMTPGPSPGNSPGSLTSTSTCDRSGQGCAGNPNQFCGSSVASDVYEDPSFPAAAGASNAANFDYIGCFTNTAPGPFYVTLSTPDTAQCAGYCGQLGYPFSGRMGYNSQTGTATCGCGSEIQTGTQADEVNCNYYCNGSTNAA